MHRSGRRSGEHPHSHPTGLFNNELPGLALGYEPTISRLPQLPIIPYNIIFPDTHTTVHIEMGPDTSKVRSSVGNPIWLCKYITVFSLTVLMSELNCNISWLEPFFNSCWRALTQSVALNKVVNSPQHLYAFPLSLNHSYPDFLCVLDRTEMFLAHNFLINVFEEWTPWRETSVL